MTPTDINSLPHVDTLDCRNMPLSVKKVQTFDTPDGGGYNCELHWKGKLVAKVHQAGHGGCTDFWHIQEAWAAAKDEINAFVDGLPRMEPSQYFPEGLKRDLELVVEDLVDWHDKQKWLKRNLKTKVMFQLVPENGPDWPTNFSSWTSYKLGNHPVEKWKEYILKNDAQPGMKIIFADAFV